MWKVRSPPMTSSRNTHQQTSMHSRCPGVVAIASIVFVFCMLPPGALAQTPGVSSTEIKVGSCSVIDGPARQLGVETILGATAYFNHVNEEGGIRGRKL